MNDRFLIALPFGAGWAPLGLLVAFLLFKVRENAVNPHLTRRQRRLRRYAVWAALVSACIAAHMKGYGPSEYSWVISTIIGLVSWAIIVMVGLISYEDAPQTEPTRTGYRAVRPADRDGPHT